MLKVRFGFVSNSSSSSFVIRKTNKLNRDALEEMLEKLVEAYNLSNEDAITVSDICYINELDDIDEIGLEGFNYGNSKKITLEQFKAMNSHTEAIPGFEVASTGDNSIPWGIMEFLDNVGTRYHWG